MPPSKAPKSTVKKRVFELFRCLEDQGIHVDDAQLSDIEPLFASLNRPCTANTLYIYRFMFKNPGKFEKMRARAEKVRAAVKGKK